MSSPCTSVSLTERGSHSSATCSSSPSSAASRSCPERRQDRLLPSPAARTSSPSSARAQLLHRLQPRTRLLGELLVPSLLSVDPRPAHHRMQLIEPSPSWPCARECVHELLQLLLPVLSACGHHRRELRQPCTHRCPPGRPRQPQPRCAKPSPSPSTPECCACLRRPQRRAPRAEHDQQLVPPSGRAQRRLHPLAPFQPRPAWPRPPPSTSSSPPCPAVWCRYSSAEGYGYYQFVLYL